MKKILLTLVLGLILLNGCGSEEISKEEAEKLAINEFIDVVSNIMLKESGGKVDIRDIKELEEVYVTYSYKQGDKWIVILGDPEGTFEVYVYSKENIRIPFIEEVIKKSDILKEKRMTGFHITLLNWGDGYTDRYTYKYSHGTAVFKENECNEDCAKKCMELNMKFSSTKFSKVIKDDKVYAFHCECYCEP